MRAWEAILGNKTTEFTVEYPEYHIGLPVQYPVLDYMYRYEYRY